MQHLRQEILNSQQVRSELMKWKLGLVGVLGAVGLGLAGSDAAGNAELVLCAVPFVGVYVDLLCRHLSLRILVIGTYLRLTPGVGERSEREELGGYERFVEERARRLELPRAGPSSLLGRSGQGPRDAAGDRIAESQTGNGASAFELEDWALSWSSVAVSAAVLAYGLGLVASAPAPAGALIAAGAAGILVTLLSRSVYERRQRAVRELAPPP